MLMALRLKMRTVVVGVVVLMSTGVLLLDAGPARAWVGELIQAVGAVAAAYCLKRC